MSNPEEKYRAMITAAEAKGYDLTPALLDDFRKLSHVDDRKINDVRRSLLVHAMAAEFKVPIAVMEVRIGGLKSGGVRNV